LALFSIGLHPVIELLQEMKVGEMSPLEAINKLYEMKRMLEAGEE